MLELWTMSLLWLMFPWNTAQHIYLRIMTQAIAVHTVAAVFELC